jgi:ribosomal protein S18 acetylase RimI-like enzyme
VARDAPLSARDAETFAAALDENFAELLAWYASWPGGDLRQDDDVWLCRTGVQFRAINAATRARLTPVTAGRRIQEVVDFFTPHDEPWRWLVGASSRPPDLGARLIAAGLTLVSDNPGMALELGRPAEPRPPIDGLEIGRVDDEADHERWRDVQRRGLELDDVRDEAWWVAHRRPGFGTDQPLVNWVASMAGRPVAAAALFIGGGVAGIYNVVTVPEARGSGYGRAVTSVALDEGRRRGLRLAVLGSSELGVPVYRSLGFREVSRLRSYTVLDEVP